MREVDHRHIAIVGAGFAGVGMTVALKRAGYDDVVVLERAAELGGVWRDNTYPGCQCDVQSNLYSFSFAPKHDWSRSFGLQQEIWSYLEDCADRFGVRPHIRFGTTVLDARWDDEAGRWRITTSTGELTADVLVSGTGALVEPSLPDLPGLDRFEGVAFHSATWRHDYDLAGKRVAVIGTGASAVQFVPAIAPKVAELALFQRTPPWIVPRMDRPVPARVRERYRKYPLLQRLSRLWTYWTRELLVPGFVRWPAMMRIPQFMASRHLARQVADPALRARLTPDYSIGCKRIILSDEWYPTLQRSNVEVVSDRIVEVRAQSIVTEDGAEREVDAIVFGTGFRVTTNPVFDLYHGRDGRSLGEVWRRDGMAAYKGTTVAGFPNLFLIIGPNTGLGHSSVLFMMESQFDYVVDAVRTLERNGAAGVNVRPEAQAAFNASLHRKLASSVWNSGGCASWYLDDRGRNTTLWPGFTWQFRLATRRFDAGAYELLARRPERVEESQMTQIPQMAADQNSA